MIKKENQSKNLGIIFFVISLLFLLVLLVFVIGYSFSEFFKDEFNKAINKGNPLDKPLFFTFLSLNAIAIITVFISSIMILKNKKYNKGIFYSLNFIIVVKLTSFIVYLFLYRQINPLDIVIPILIILFLYTPNRIASIIRNK
ncbi:MAG: hypothetical protein WC867_07900 [Candidatus Pacearchaeota archaeon]|jgi:magnesium-transporting ATPase (P-type)